MLRPFALRDVALVRRLSDQGTMLQAEAALTGNPHPLRSALVSMLLGGHHSTFVWRADDSQASAFVQLRWTEGQPSAQIAFVGLEASGSTGRAPDSGDGDIWLPLFEQLFIETGRRGLHNLVAEVSEAGPELQVLRRAGFAVYTRQDIWISECRPEGSGADILRPRQPVDDWDIQLLYANVVPRLIQAVEPNPPLEHGQSWVLREDAELSALVHLNDGPVATWMRVLVHPNADIGPEAIIEAALRIKEPRPEHPVYCCVRRYQSWFQGALEKAGFRIWGSQAVMVKHIAQHIESPAPAQVKLLEPQAATGSSPLVQGFSHPAGKVHCRT